MLWRGPVEWPTFMDGRTYINTGGMDAKFVCYPMASGTKAGTQLMNWATVVRRAEPGGRSTCPRRLGSGSTLS